MRIVGFVCPVNMCLVQRNDGARRVSDQGGCTVQARQGNFEINLNNVFQLQIQDGLVDTTIKTVGRSLGRFFKVWGTS